MVDIPVRTHEISVYFNKTTPEDYYADALKKVQKIHNRLPEGDVLVFLTGKKEIVEFAKDLFENLQKTKSLF